MFYHNVLGRTCRSTDIGTVEPYVLPPPFGYNMPFYRYKSGITGTFGRTARSTEKRNVEPYALPQPFGYNMPFYRSRNGRTIRSATNVSVTPAVLPI